MHAQSPSCVRLFATPWTAPTRLLHPWDFPGKSTASWLGFIKFTDFLEESTNMHKLLQLHPTLCNPMDCSSSGSSTHGILQARILEWVAIFSYSDLPNPGIKFKSLMSPALAGGFFVLPLAPPGKL